MPKKGPVGALEGDGFWDDLRNATDSAVSYVGNKAKAAASFVTDTANKVKNTATALVLGGVTSPGFAYFKNLDPTNYIEIGRMDITGTNFVPVIKLNALQYTMGWIVTNAPYAKAHTAAASSS